MRSMETNHQRTLTLSLEAFLLLIRAMDKDHQYNLQLFMFFHALCSSPNTDYYLHRDALQLYPENHSLHVPMLKRLATPIAFRLLREGDLPSGLPILLFPIHTPCLPNFNTHILVLIGGIYARWERLNDLRDLEDFIQYQGLVLARTSLSYTAVNQLKAMLGMSLIELSSKTGNMIHVNQAINCLQQCDPSLSSRRNGPFNAPYLLLKALFCRYLVFRDPADLEKATPCLINVITGYHLPNRIDVLIWIFGHLRYWKNAGITSHLDPVISCMEDLIPQLPPEAKSLIFKQLADAYIRRFEKFGGISDLDGYVSHTRNSLQHQPPGTPECLQRVIDVAQAYQKRHIHSNSPQDLHDAVEYAHVAAKQLPSTSPNPYTLTTMSTMFRLLFLETHDISTLDKAISFARGAVEMSTPEEASERAGTLVTLSDALFACFRHLGAIADLDESIQHLREAVGLLAPQDSMLGSALSKLSYTLFIRFTVLRRQDDIHEVLKYSTHSESSAPLPLREIVRILSEIDLPDWLEPKKCSLDTMVQHLEQELRSCENSEICSTTLALGAIIALRASQEGNINDLDRTIELLYSVKRSASLSFSPIVFEGLALVHSTRFRLGGEISDLEAMISAYLNVISSFSVRPFELSRAAIGLANAYAKRSQVLQQPSDLEKALPLYEKAANASTCDLKERLGAARKWATIARKTHHESALQAYTSALSLLNRFITVSRTVEGRYARLAKACGSLPEKTASLAIDKNYPETAIEFLEQGRAILWSQVGRYRTPVDRLEETNPSLAEDFRQISALLEEKSIASSTSLGGFDPPVYRSHSQRWDAVVEKIRAEEGFSNFLKQTPFATLQKAALNGPVIVINIDKFHSDAIIVRNDHPPIVVPVPEATPHAIASLVGDFLHALQTLRDKGESSLDNPGIKLTITNTLQHMWSILVGPIVEVLSGECHLAQGSRVWWCPTGMLWSFPIHAAGPYQPGKRNLPDIFVSSYTPTLSALLQSIKSRTGEASRASVNMLVVGQAQTPGQAKLPNVLKEIEKVREHCPSARLLEEAAATRHAVSCGLQQYSWVHFSCHGKQDRDQPFNSCFVLHNETLSLLDIAQIGMSNADFAFLSACHSAAGDLRTPNEAIHLASGLQFSGFKSVVGTMWAMADIDGPVVADEFYRYMFRNRGGADHQDAAVALNLATKALRKMKVPLERWINFIHIGA